MADKTGVDTSTEDVTETDETTEDETDESGEDEYTPPTQDEWKRTKDALKRANEQAKTWRLKARELEKGQTQGTDDAVTQASKAATDKYRPALVKQAARAALLEAGLVDPTPERLKKVLRLIDTQGVDIDDDGEVAGLEDQVEELKTDYPEFFTAPEGRRVARVNGAGRKAAGAKPKTSAELLAAQMGF